MEVCGNSSHPVVGCRCDWDRLLKGVETVTAASFQDGWKALLGLISGDLREVKTNVVDALQAHALQQRSAHLISRCKISSGQVCDRALAGSIHQSSPIASHSLGDQKAGGS